MTIQIITSTNAPPEASQPMMDADCLKAEAALNAKIVTLCSDYETKMAPEIHALMRAQLMASKNTLLLQISLLKCSGCSAGTFKTKVACALKEMDTLALKAVEQNKAFIELTNKTKKAYEASLERLKKGQTDSASEKEGTRVLLYTVGGGVLAMIPVISYQLGKEVAASEASALVIKNATAALDAVKTSGCKPVISACETHLAEVVAAANELQEKMRATAVKKSFGAGAAGALAGAFVGWGITKAMGGVGALVDASPLE